MTRDEALQALRRLGVGLKPDRGGVGRLLERASLTGQAELLRAALTEYGAERLLDEMAP